MLDQINLVVSIGTLLLVFVLARRFETVFKGFGRQELDYILRGLQQRLTKSKKREGKRR